MSDSQLAIVLAGSSAGAPRGGSELGPRAILNSSLYEQLQGHFSQVHVPDINQIPSNDTLAPDDDHRGMKNPRTVSKATLNIHDLVYHHALKDQLVLTIGGDHSNAIGTITGTTRALMTKANKKPAVVCIDAHVSINPPEMSPSGNIHGMPLAFATGLARSQEPGIFDWIGDECLIDMKKLVYVGTRDVDDGEREILQANGIKVFDMKNIQRHGIDKIMNMVLEYVGQETPIHLSCDIDALDPEWASSAGHLVPGGFSLGETSSIIRRVRETGNLMAMDLVEVNPLINPDGVAQTVESACTIIKGALGLRA